MKKKNQKKIIIVVENLLYGGVTTHLTNLLNSKAFRQFEIILITNKTNEGVKNIINSCKTKNIKIVFYNSLNTFKIDNIFLKFLIIIFKPILFVISFFQMYLILKKYRFDILMGNCGGYGDFRSEMASVLAGQLLGIKNIFLLIHHSYTKPRMWSGLINLFNLLIGKYVKSFFFVSHATKTSIIKNTSLFSLFKNKSYVIHNGVTLKKFKKTKVKELNVKSGTLKIGMLSRIERYKGQSDLIDAFANLPKKIKSKYKVFFVGSGNLKEVSFLKKKILKNNLSNNIKIIKYINKDSLIILSNFDLFLSLTRDFEGFGYSIAEALYVGTPVISTKVGGVTEYLNRKNSELIKPMETKKLTELLKNFKKDRKKWKTKIAYGKKLISYKYNSEIMSEKYFKLLN